MTTWISSKRRKPRKQVSHPSSYISSRLDLFCFTGSHGLWQTGNCPRVHECVRVIIKSQDPGSQSRGIVWGRGSKIDFFPKCMKEGALNSTVFSSTFKNEGPVPQSLPITHKWLSVKRVPSPNQTSGNPPVLGPWPMKTVEDLWKPLLCRSSCPVKNSSRSPSMGTLMLKKLY